MWIAIFPTVLITIPSHIFNIIDKDRESNWWEEIKKSLAIYLLIGVATCLLSPLGLIWVKYNQDSLLGFLIAAGVMFWIIILVCIILWLREKYLDSKSYKSHRGEPKQYIVIEFVKAKYNKLCPKINWK